MKRISIALLSFLCAAPAFADAGARLIPAGSLIGCTLSEPKLSSKTTAVGDPVLCQVGHSERYGRSVMPYSSYLVGRFEDYKDPGHFVGKGWMELRFDRMVIEPDTVIPIDARVVDVPGYKVDSKGRILGKGHAVRDTVLWTIPILWPIDLINLPRRGPRPTLKEESRLTLKILDDLEIPPTQPQQLPVQDPYGLMHRSPNSYNDAPPPPMQDQPAPQQYADAAPPMDQQPMEQPQPDQYAYAPPPPPPVAPYAYAPMIAPPPVVYGYGGVYVGPRVGIGFGYGGAYAPRMYAPRGYAPGPRGYGYGGAPRAYGYGGARGYGYGAPRQAAQGGYARGGSGMMARGGMSYGGGGSRGGGGGYRGGR
jgi:uncharacterized membrane protein YgcG